MSDTMAQNGTDNATIDWSTGLADGVIIELTIRRYRGVSTADWSSLGLDTSIGETMGKYLLPSQKRLLPPKLDAKLKTIETQARNNLSTHSFQCDMLGTKGKFVPLAAYLDFKARNEALQKDFYSIRDDIADNYDDVVSTVRKDYEEFVRKFLSERHLYDVKTDIDTLVSDIVAQIPSHDDMVGSFEFVTSLRRVPRYVISSADLGIDGRAGELRASTPPMVCLGRKGKVPDIAMARKRLEEDLASSGGKTDKATADFLTSTAIRLREITIEGGTKVIDSIDRNDNMLVGRASIMAHNLVSLVRALDYYGDADMQEAIDWFAYELDGRALRSVPKVRTAASSMVAWAQASMRFLNGEVETQPQSVESMRSGDKNKAKRSRRTRTDAKNTRSAHDGGGAGSAKRRSTMPSVVQASEGKPTQKPVSQKREKKQADTARATGTVSTKRQRKGTIVIPTIDTNERTIRSRDA